MNSPPRKLYNAWFRYLTVSVRIRVRFRVRVMVRFGYDLEKGKYVK